jgi:ABC-type phosphate/phosphonate transport system substrate-binding protein
MELGRSIGQIRESLKEHSVDLLVLDTTEYLSLADAGLIEAVAAGTNRGQLLAFPYLLLTKDALEAGQLDVLRGKRIVVASRTKSNLGLVWLETLLAENRLGRAASFFGSVEIGYRASACVLPLFFGKIDACVVDTRNWESIKELNPQLGRLRVAARSEALLEGLIAMPIEPHLYQSELIDSILNLHKTPAGEQLCMVFKTGTLVRVGREPFESVRVLCNRYRRIVDRSGDGSGHDAGRLGELAGKERH